MTKREKMQEKEERFLNDFPETHNLHLKANKMGILGMIDEPFELSHKVRRTKIFEAVIKVPRRSTVLDFIPVQIPEKLLSSDFQIDQSVKVLGEFRSCNEEGHLKNYLWGKSIITCNQLDENNNMIYLEACVYKPPIYRKTPLGREITDLLVIVNGDYGQSTIPCIAWEEKARQARDLLEVGSHIQIWGRMQSREFFKRFSEDSEEGEIRRICELSIADFV